MVDKQRSSDPIVVRDSRPLQAVLLGFCGLVLASWAIRRPVIGVPLLLGWLALTVVAHRSPRTPTVASVDGIAGLRVRVPLAAGESWFASHEVVRSVTPWDQVESVRVGSSALSLSGIRIRLTDGREADLDANAITRRGLRKIAHDLERLRVTAA